MGIISVERADSLFWLGRYTERVFTTVKVFFDYYDRMLDIDPEEYKKFCELLSIPDVYENQDDFAVKYIIDESNPDSIINNMQRAYDNAIVSRDDVSSESMAYLELCLQEIRKSKNTAAPLLALQSVIDLIYAFWGSIDDCIIDEENRNLVKCGRYVERIDMYLRLSYPHPAVYKEFLKFQRRLAKINMNYSKDRYELLLSQMEEQAAYPANRLAMLGALQTIFC